jgi:hypothetical protein
MNRFERNRQNSIPVTVLESGHTRVVCVDGKPHRTIFKPGSSRAGEVIQHDLPRNKIIAKRVNLAANGRSDA